MTAAVLLASASNARAQRIYLCTDAAGKTHTSDRPIGDCGARDQRLLNPDGSLNRIVPPTPTAEERAAMEQRQREVDAELNARNEAIRRDRNLLQRFPNEQKHREAREKALDDVRRSVAISQQRVAALVVERKPLDAELEFYQPPKKPPFKLRLAIDSNEALMNAQKALIANQQIEVVRINTNYDAELLHLKKLWAGAPPGSLMAVPLAVAPSRTTAR